ncbi:uncharacterized protein LOC127710483 [Mytilus californianus]|uniref:uncharacterized protein LOC127710483 n=1 Tax=Mytilus californianus TaxID=6549 RepID=UPI0022481071|nr:uncharacterized protein LOC127710483 [Mytilus californianus]XP_052072322.1 uncharacterized protein LOC127710483 [Mytilus californianus]
MSVSGPDIGFTDLTDLGKGHRGYAHQLTSLFNQCDFGTVETHRHTISFKEASKRLRKQMMESFEYIEIQTGRLVKEFNIGKTHVYSQYSIDFNPTQPSTWAPYGGLSVSWENYKKKGFDGMIALGCVIKDIIPQVIRDTNKALEINHHSYAAGLAQSLVQYYLLQNPDDRLRSVTVEDLGNNTGKDELGSPASVIYAAYKLEPKTTNSFQELKIKDEPDDFIVNQSAIDLLETKLSGEGLYFRGEISNDGNSFFRSCSDQLERLEMPSMDHAELRQKIAQQMRGMPTDQIHDAHFTNEEWNIFIKKIAEDGEHIEDVVVEKMAILLKKKIVIYSLSYANEISKKSINDEASGTPFLLGKEKSYYTSLERGQGTSPVSKDKQNACQKRPAKNVQFAGDVSLAKQPKQTKAADRKSDVSFGGDVMPDKESDKSATFSAKLIKSSTPVKIVQEGPSTEGAPTKRKQVTKPMKKLTKDEKLLILRCYHALQVKGDWDKLAEMVYSRREEKLSREMVHHYEQNLDLKTTLKNRIKDFIMRVTKDKGENEKDSEVKALIQLI